MYTLTGIRQIEQVWRQTALVNGQYIDHIGTFSICNKQYYVVRYGSLAIHCTTLDEGIDEIFRQLYDK